MYLLCIPFMEVYKKRQVLALKNEAHKGNNRKVYCEAIDEKTLKRGEEAFELWQDMLIMRTDHGYVRKGQKGSRRAIKVDLCPIGEEYAKYDNEYACWRGSTEHRLGAPKLLNKAYEAEDDRYRRYSPKGWACLACHTWRSSYKNRFCGCGAPRPAFAKVMKGKLRKLLLRR